MKRARCQACGGKRAWVVHGQTSPQFCYVSMRRCDTCDGTGWQLLPYLTNWELFRERLKAIELTQHIARAKKEGEA